jgi:hypothetical protein
MGFEAGSISATLGLDTAPFVSPLKVAVSVSQQSATAMQSTFATFTANVQKSLASVPLSAAEEFKRTQAASAAIQKNIQAVTTPDYSSALKLGDKIDLGETLNTQMQQAGGKSGESFSKGFFSQLKSDLGKGSTLGMLTKLALGGGVIGGLSLATGKLNELTKAAEEFQVEWSKGADAQQAALSNLAKSIPIYGDIWSAGRRIHDMITGEAVAQHYLNEELKSTQIAVQSIGHALDLNRNISKTVAEELRKTGIELARMGKSGLDLKLFDITISGQSKLDDLRGKIEELKKQRDDLYADRQNQQEQLNTLRMGTEGKMQISHEQKSAIQTAQGNLDRINTDLAKVNKLLDESQGKWPQIKANIDRITAGNIFKTFWGEATHALSGYLAEMEKVNRANQQLRTSMLQDLKKENRQFNMNENQKKLDDFSGLKPTAGNLEVFKRELDFNDQLKAGKFIKDLDRELNQIDLPNWKKRLDDAMATGLFKTQKELDAVKGKLVGMDVKQMLRGIETPLEKFKRMMSDLDELKNASKDINDEQYSKLQEKIRTDVFGPTKKLEKLYISGSAEAQALAYDQSRQAGADSPQDQIKQQTGLQKQMVDYLSRVEKWMQKMNGNYSAEETIDLAVV